MKKRKATRKQLETVVTAILRDLQNLNARVSNVEFCFDTLLKFKKDEEKFAKFAEERIKEYNEKRGKESLEDGVKGGKRDK